MGWRQKLGDAEELFTAPFLPLGSIVRVFAVSTSTYSP